MPKKAQTSTKRAATKRPTIICIFTWNVGPLFQDGQPLVTSFPEAEAEIRRLKEELSLSRQQNGDEGDSLIQQMESRENEKNSKIKAIEKSNKNLKLEKDKIHKLFVFTTCKRLL